MSSEYELRRKKADDVLDRVGHYLKGLMIVGSVAYNPEAVTEKSDLDLVGVVNFSDSEFNFREFEDHALSRGMEFMFPPLHQDYVDDHYTEKKANVAVFRWNEEFKVALYLWDTTALEQVVSLGDVNRRFHEQDDFTAMFRNGVDYKTLHSYSGKTRNFFTNPIKVKSGLICDLPVLPESEGELYAGVQVNNFILSPVILHQEGTLLSDTRKDMMESLSDRLKKVYGGRHNEEISIFNSLPYKTRPRIGEELRRELDNFY